MEFDGEENKQVIPELGTTLGEGWSSGQRQVRLYDLSGDHYEMGYQQGLQTREAIHHSLEHLEELETMKIAKPFSMPFRLYLSVAARRAAGEMSGDVSEGCPRQRMRIEGIAKGAGVDESLIYLAQSLELAIADINYRLGACTAVAVAAERSTRNELMVIKNFDYPAFFQPYYVTRMCRPPEAGSSMDVTIAPMAGCHDGMNEHGLCLSCNYGYGTDMPKSNIPVSLLVQETLENCANTREAVEYLRGGSRSGGALILVADAEGESATVELSPNFSGVRGPEEGILINTNHYRCREMTSYDIPRNAYYTNKNVRALRGIRVHESSELRYGRVQQLLAEIERVSMKDLLGVFCDHGESGRGDDNTICRHGAYFSTTCSVIMLPRSKRLLVTYGHPCESVFTDFPDLFAAETAVEDEGGATREPAAGEDSAEEP